MPAVASPTEEELRDIVRRFVAAADSEKIILFGSAAQQIYRSLRDLEFAQSPV